MSQPYDGYEKIPQTSGEWGLDERATRAAERARWVVTEKIHGANFCFLIDEDSILCAKRREIIAPGESFFAHERLVAELGEVLRALWGLAAAKIAGLERLDVHGELFGGGYPHPDVAPVAGVEPVQTGVWYAPGVAFMAFDLAIWAPDEAGESARSYLGYDEARALCAEAGVPWLDALHIGTWAEALAYDIEFETTIPALLGLPPLGAENRSEGVVIKPAEPLLLDGIRPVIKRKIAAFMEDERFHEARAWRREAPGQAVAPLALLEWEVMARLNGARLASAESKVGRADRAAVAAEVARDVWEEVCEAHGGLWSALGADERALLWAVLEDEALVLAGA